MTVANENPINACRAILWMLSRHVSAGSRNGSIRAALIADLLWKARAIEDPVAKASVLAQATVETLSPRLLGNWSKEKLGIAELAGALESLVRVRRQVGIVTVLPIERDAVLDVFGVNLETPHVVGGLKFWYGELLAAGGEPVPFVIGMVGKARNVPMAIYVDRMLSHFKLETMLVVGIAAGPEDKVRIGDAIVSERVLDYEAVRSELVRGEIIERPRPQYIELKEDNFRRVKDFELKAGDEITRILRDTGSVSFEAAKTVAYLKEMRVLAGTIAAGERLIADRSLPLMRQFVDERIRAADQEDSGFAQACEFNGIDWCAFRGVADFGDPYKADAKQKEASFAAAIAARAFMFRWHRPAMFAMF